MVTGSSALSVDNPVFQSFVTYCVVVLGKTMIMSVVTAANRFAYKSFANPEDSKGMKDREGGKLKPVLNNPQVERVRRCHLNDLENVLPFVLVGLLYVSTSPPLGRALLCFRIFTVSRLIHSVAYLLPLPQPSRALSFFAGYFTTFYMAYSAAANVGFAL